MYCKYCGKQIDDNSKFCQHCGKSLNSGATVNLSNISLGGIEFNALLFSSIVFIISVMLWFPSWVSVSIWNGSSTYSASLLYLMDLCSGASELSRMIDSDTQNVFAALTVSSWVFIVMEIIILILFFVGVYYHKRAAYRRGIFFSFLAVIFSATFSISTSLIGNDFSDASYNIVKNSVGVAPVIILITNLIAFAWLLIERRNQPEEDVFEEEEDDFENIDYEDDLTDDNADEFWEKMLR